MCEALNTVFVSLSIGPVSIYVVKGWLACWAIDYKRLLAQQQDHLSLDDERRPFTCKFSVKPSYQPSDSAPAVFWVGHIVLQLVPKVLFISSLLTGAEDTWLVFFSTGKVKLPKDKKEKDKLKVKKKKKNADDLVSLGMDSGKL